LLRQFSQELRSNIRSGDHVGRWGGDEFIVVFDCDLSAATSQVERIQKWVLGEYTISTGPGAKDVKITVGASIGLAEWHPGETMQRLIARADSTMYTEKQQARAQKAGGKTTSSKTFTVE
jgi:two-component system, chemotaxis family, sensor kinase Cph1